MPLIKGKSEKSFKKNVETEMHARKPQKQALAIAYSLKRKAKKMMAGGDCYAEGGQITDNYQSSCTADCNDPCMVHPQAEYMESEYDKSHPMKSDHTAMKEDEEMSPDHEDMVSRVMRMSKGGKVANSDMPTADFMPNEFDDLHMRDDLESSYTGDDSGDELSDAREDHDRADIISKVMKSRRKKDRLPSPA